MRKKLSELPCLNKGALNTSKVSSMRQTSISSISCLTLISDDSEFDVTEPDGISGVFPLLPKSYWLCWFALSSFASAFLICSWYAPLSGIESTSPPQIASCGNGVARPLPRVCSFNMAADNGWPLVDVLLGLPRRDVRGRDDIKLAVISGAVEGSSDPFRLFELISSNCFRNIFGSRHRWFLNQVVTV